MRKKVGNILCLLILLSCFGSTFFCSAQTEEKTSLLSVLSAIETRFNVRFSYASEEIKTISIVAPSEVNTLDETLTYLEKNIPFQLKKINERYFAITPYKETQWCGTIISIETGTPLVGATIVEDSGTFSVVSDSEGRFFIDDQKSSTFMTISYVGYKNLRISTSELTRECVHIFMEAETTTLETVVLNSYLTKGITKHANGKITLNTRNFGLIPGQVENDVLQIAQVLPGVESVDETISNINIRGGTHAENLILWEDIKMYQSGHFFGLISAFNPDLTKDVSVYKNGTPSRYGDAVSGVIDMRSEDHIASQFKGGGGLNLIHANAFFEIPFSEKFGLQFAARTSLNSLIETPVYKTYSQRIFQDTEIERDDETNPLLSAQEDFYFYDISTKFLWNPSERDAFGFRFLTIDNRLDYNETIIDNNSSKNSNLDQRSIATGASWKRKWNERFHTSASLYLSYYFLNAVNRDIFTTQRLIQENEVVENGVKLESALQLSENITIQNGYQFNETGISNTQDVNLPRFRDFQKEVIRTHSAFSEVTFISENNNTALTSGLRFNYITKFKELLIEPRLSVRQKLNNQFAIEAKGEFKSQTTTQRIDFESDFLGVEKRRWVLANEENIPIIKSKQASVGVSYETIKWLISLEGFYKVVDGISSINQGFQNQFQFTNSQGQYQVSGIEAVINKRTKHFHTWVSYSWTNNEYTFDAFSPSVFPNNLDREHSATLAGSYYSGNFKLAIGVNWQSGKPYTLALPEQMQSINSQDPINYDAPNNERLPDYFRADISSEYSFSLSENSTAKISVALLNVFDYENTLNTRYARLENSDGTNTIREINEVSLGLTPNAAIQILF
ncbi:carboxypeptidase-like regulatory domain-containing protein [Jejudonia soesokkakensis]|uniref:Carboxypeptidase-like regulatory domain-containing protein n=1 Tax=Jejudonia soesokkakensis TaxID=1323432 RepID=A0ABW2MXX7_9FLAO